MRKTILIIILITLTVLFFSLVYLSTYGVKTDNFNTFINTKVKEYNSRLNLKLDDVFIKLNLIQGSLNINTKDAILIAENNEIKILNTDINLNIIKFIKKENSIKNIKIRSSDNSLKRLLPGFILTLFSSIPPSIKIISCTFPSSIPAVYDLPSTVNALLFNPISFCCKCDFLEH